MGPALAGAVALLGWTLGADSLKAVLPGLIAMNPLTAICFIVLAGALCLRNRVAGKYQRLGAVLAVAVAAVGGLKLGSVLLGYPLSIDLWLFAAALGENRMAPSTALCFFLSGAAVAGIDYVAPRGFWPAQVATLAAATVSLAALVGYSYGATSPYVGASYVPMALNSAAAFDVLALGILLARPERGVMAVVLSPGVGGEMTRRLIPAVIAIPWLFGGLHLFAQQRLGYHDTIFGVALLAVAVTVGLFVVTVSWIAAALNHSEAERQQAMNELRRSSAQIFDLYNRAPCGYHSLDPSGTVISINDTELAWLGYEREEVVGKKTFSELITPASVQTYRDNFTRFKLAGSVKDLEFEMLRRDGGTFPVILNSVAIYDADGNYVASRSMVFDSTEQKRAEAAIQQLNQELELRVAHRTAELAAANADLEQKNRENEVFVYSASHDLRSPLVNLQAFSQELAGVSQNIRQLLVSANLPAEQSQRGRQLIDVDLQRNVRFIQTAVGRLGGIIDALLRLSRAGRVEHQPQWVDARQLVARIVDSMSATLRSRGMAIEVADLPACWGDPTAIDQVFANLLGNAVSYLDSRRPGKIEVGTLPAEYPQDGTLAGTIYYVKDNGVGIDRAYHGKVFQGLKRLHPELAKGEGMGLAIVKRIVDRHGGKVWFESSAGQGTTFFVELPNPSTDPVAVHAHRSRA